eukprot:1459049-Rhodomonas_salina.2
MHLRVAGYRLFGTRVQSRYPGTDARIWWYQESVSSRALGSIPLSPLRIRYVQSGTDVGYAPTRQGRLPWGDRRVDRHSESAARRKRKAKV